MRSYKSRRIAFMAPGVLSFMASLFVTGFYVDDFYRGLPGINILEFGWLGIFSAWPSNYTWLANPLLVGAWIVMFFGNRRSAIVLALLALVVGAAFLLCKTIMVDESGALHSISGYGTGYWLWLFSMGCTTVGAFLESRYWRADAAR